jgi:CTP synthase (UTP-ammonia lyase)
MTNAPRLALIGDHDPASKAHQGIPLALSLAAADGRICECQWIHTSQLTSDASAQLGGFDGIWCVPGSPYANGDGVIAAIRFARESGRPFLGTCGGFQHALLEYAGAVWGVAHPRHAETDPGAPDPVIAPLSCTLVEVSGEVHFAGGSRLHTIYGAASFVESYHCSYGVNPACRSRLQAGPLRATAWDGAGDVRAVELDDHPFFIGTLFQPERSGLAGHSHPLIRAFVAALR